MGMDSSVNAVVNSGYPGVKEIVHLHYINTKINS
jgi:hypothetical protein